MQKHKEYKKGKKGEK